MADIEVGPNIIQPFLVFSNVAIETVNTGVDLTYLHPIHTYKIFLDFRKAFDTINHNILIDKMKMLCVGNGTTKLLEGYLSNRHQRTIFHGYKSEVRKVHTGVPQGSILGPLLFLAYINDLSSCLTYSQCQLFADDTVLITKHANRNVSYANLQADISKINEWCRVNQLTINAKKTEYIEFTNKRNQPANDIITLNLGDHVLIRAPEYKYLGTVLDQHLTGIPQYNKVMKSITSKIANFAKLRYLINTETALTIYKTTILPILDYNDFMYYLLPDNKLKKIETFQNRSLRCVSNYHPMHVQEMRTMAKLPSLF